MSVESIEAGVHLYDTNTEGAIWVYLPLEFIPSRGMWRCDVLTVFSSGEISARSDVIHSARYLASMFKDLYV